MGRGKLAAFAMAKADLSQPEDDAADVRKLEALGITKGMMEQSSRWPTLGPLSGISNAARLLRGLRFNKVCVEDVLLDLVLKRDEEAAAEREARRALASSNPQKRSTSMLLDVPSIGREFVPRQDPLPFPPSYRYPTPPPVRMCRACMYILRPQFGCRCDWVDEADFIE